MDDTDQDGAGLIHHTPDVEGTEPRLNRDADRLLAVAEWFTDCKSLVLEPVPHALIRSLRRGAAALQARSYESPDSEQPSGPSAGARKDGDTEAVVGASGCERSGAPPLILCAEKHPQNAYACDRAAGHLGAHAATFNHDGGLWNTSWPQVGSHGTQSVSEASGPAQSEASSSPPSASALSSEIEQAKEDCVRCINWLERSHGRDSSSHRKELLTLCDALDHLLRVVSARYEQEIVQLQQEIDRLKG